MLNSAVVPIAESVETQDNIKNTRASTNKQRKHKII
jgi:hypothetical protein